MMADENPAVPAIAVANGNHQPEVPNGGAADNYKSWADFNGEYPIAYLLARFCKISYDHDVSQSLKHSDFKEWEFVDKKLMHRYNYKGFAAKNTYRKQVVIVHRGTYNSRWKIWRCCNWISNCCISCCCSKSYQINPASAFTQKIRENADFADYQIIITGHSMGGLLAQVTAFTVKYFDYKNGGYTLRASDKWAEIHPHVVCFDSPGALDTISRFIKKYQGNPADEDLRAHSLDVTAYLAAPDLVNLIGTQFSETICVNVLRWDDANEDTSGYCINSCCRLCRCIGETMNEHNIDNIIDKLKKMEELKRVSTWGLKPAYECVDNKKIPIKCFTPKELNLLHTANDLKGLKLGDPCDLLASVIIDIDKKWVEVRPEIDCDKFVPFVHHLMRNDYERDLTNEAFAQLNSPEVTAKKKLISFNFNEIKLYSMILKNFTLPHISRTIYIEHDTEFSKQMAAVLIANTWRSENGQSAIVVDTNNSNYLRTIQKPLQRLKKYQPDEKWLLVIAGDGPIDNPGPLEEIVDCINQLKCCIHEYIYIGGEIGASNAIVSWKFLNLHATSQTTLLNLPIRFQNSDALPLTLSRDIIETCEDLLPVFEKFNLGLFLPNTCFKLSESSKNFYEPLKLERKSHCQKITEQYSDRLCIEKTGQPHLSIVTGKPGSGKTSFCQNLSKEFSIYFASEKQDVMVLVLPLRQLNCLISEVSITRIEDVKSVIKAYYELPAVDLHFFDMFFDRERSVVYIIDGFDELRTENVEKAKKMVQLLRSHRSMFRMWITTRSDADSIIPQPAQDCVVYQIKDLDEIAINNYATELVKRRLPSTSNNSQPQILASLHTLLRVDTTTSEEFFGVPLTLKLLVDAKAYTSNMQISKPHHLIKIYIIEKLRFFWKKKKNIDPNSDELSDSALQGIFYENPFNFFLLLAMAQLYGVDNFPKTYENICKSFSVMGSLNLRNLRECGLLDGNGKFFHGTVAEFMVAHAISMMLGATVIQQSEKSFYLPDEQPVESIDKLLNKFGIMASLYNPMNLAEVIQVVVYNNALFSMATGKMLSDMLFHHAAEHPTKRNINQVKKLAKHSGQLLDWLSNKSESIKDGAWYFLFTMLDLENVDVSLLNIVLKFCELQDQTVTIQSPPTDWIFSLMTWAFMCTKNVSQRFTDEEKLKIIVESAKHFKAVSERFKQIPNERKLLVLAHLWKRALLSLFVPQKISLKGEIFSTVSHNNQCAEVTLIKIFLETEYRNKEALKILNNLLQYNECWTFQKLCKIQNPTLIESSEIGKFSEESSNLNLNNNPDRTQQPVPTGSNTLLNLLLEEKLYKVLEVLDCICDILDFQRPNNQTRDPRQKIPLLLKMIRDPLVPENHCVELVDHFDGYFSEMTTYLEGSDVRELCDKPIKDAIHELVKHYRP